MTSLPDDACGFCQRSVLGAATSIGAAAKYKYRPNVVVVVRVLGRSPRTSSPVADVPGHPKSTYFRCCLQLLFKRGPVLLVRRAGTQEAGDIRSVFSFTAAEARSRSTWAVPEILDFALVERVGRKEWNGRQLDTAGAGVLKLPRPKRVQVVAVVALQRLARCEAQAEELDLLHPPNHRTYEKVGTVK